MANAFTKAQFMEPPSSGAGAVPIGAVKAGQGVSIAADGTISIASGSGIINEIVCTNGIQGGGSSPQVFIGLLPPTATTIGGVKTVAGSNISIDSEGVIRSTSVYTLNAGSGILLTNVTPTGATVSLRPAGSAAAALGGVYTAANGGINVAGDGAISLAPPTATAIGGVKAGTGCSISADGTISATGTGGTITGVGAGTGLGGGGTTGAVTLFVKPPSGTTIGGVYAGPNVNIAADGQISIADQAGVQTITAAPNGAIQITGTATNPIIGAYAAGLTSTGVCRLSSAIDSTEFEYVAANPLAVKTVADLANTKLPLAGGTLTGPVTFAAGQTFPDTVVASTFTQLGGILVGDTTVAPYAELPPGTNGQVLTANSAAPLGLEWTDNGTGTISNITVTDPLRVSNPQGPTASLSVVQASTTVGGYVFLYDGVDGNPPQVNSAASPTAVQTAYDLAAGALPTTGGTMSGPIVFAGSQGFPGVLPLAGGIMTGDITFAATQTFPGLLVEGAIGAQGAIEVGGTPSNPIISVDTATTSQLGVVQPDGTTITVDGSGIISAVSPSASQPDYGNWYSDNTQTAQTLITGQPVTLNQTVATNNFTLLNGSQITASADGVYNLQFSIQIVSLSGAGNVEIWLAKNGTAVANSNTAFSVKNANEAEFAALNYVETLASGDYLQLYWATDNLNCELAANLSTMGGPDIPSVIVTIVPVGA